jgi:hypothetical protein
MPRTDYETFADIRASDEKVDVRIAISAKRICRISAPLTI